MDVTARATAPACSLSQLNGAERRERWLSLAGRALSEKTPTQSGMRLRFQALQGVEGELRDLAALERECCSFASWSVLNDDESLILEVQADGDGAEVVRGLFDLSP